LDAALSKERSEEINMAVPIGEQVWSESANATLDNPKKATKKKKS